MTRPISLWFPFPLIGWGIGLTMHYPSSANAGWSVRSTGTKSRSSSALRRAG